MVMKRSGRGSVGRAFSDRKRWVEDKEYREKKLEKGKKYRQKHKKERVKYFKKYTKELNEYANKRCKVCNKLLTYRSTIGLCKKHLDMRKRLRNPRILMFYRLISKLQYIFIKKTDF